MHLRNKKSLNMASFAAQLLNELMGQDRDRAPHEKRRELHWDDRQVS